MMVELDIYLEVDDMMFICIMFIVMMQDFGFFVMFWKLLYLKGEVGGVFGDDEVDMVLYVVSVFVSLLIDSWCFVSVC